MVSAPDIPGHRVAGIIGSGGFATVYRSWQIAVGREVAVKVDNRVLLEDRDRRRFVREVTAAGRLSGHPHVIDIYDAGTLADGRPYLVMELCPAGSLNDALRRRGPMSPARVRDIGIRIADALAAAHAAGVLHRDIKPANILINRYGMVGLSDFGLASIMATGGEQSATREALTPAYAAPEAFRLEEPTVAADLYSLAATLYALLAGRPPRFPADQRSPSLATIMMLHDKPVDDVPGTPPELMALLRRSLSADPAARPPSAAALRDTLAGRAARSPRPATPAGPHRTAEPHQTGGLHQTAEPHRTGGLHRAATPARPLTQMATPAVSLASSVPTGTWGTVGPPAPTDPALPRGIQGVPGPDGTIAGKAPATSPAHRRRRVMLPIALAAGLLMVIGAAAIIGARIFPHRGAAPGAASSHDPGTRPAAVPGVFGVPTVTSGCAAASVRAAAARCPAAPECWDGLVVISGNASASGLPCTGPHYWQTFAIAILPADAQTFDQNIVQVNPSVRAVCSTQVLLRSRRGRARQIPASAWDIAVLPPDEAAFDSGARAYRCVAGLADGTELSTSQFG